VSWSLLTLSARLADVGGAVGQGRRKSVAAPTAPLNVWATISPNKTECPKIGAALNS